MKVIFGTTFICLIAATFAVLDCPKDGTNNVLLPNPEDCTSYFVCMNGFPYLKICSWGLSFDIRRLTCIDPTKATCAGSTSPAPSEPESPEESNSSVNCPEEQGPQHFTLLPNPKDCTTFWQCIYGQPYPFLEHCLKGLHFNAKKKLCEYPELANCTSTP